MRKQLLGVMGLKKTSLILVLSLLVLVCLGSSTVSASMGEWKSYETDNFVVLYPSDYEWQAQQVLYYLEEQLPQVREITGNQSDLKPYIVVQDFGLESNGISKHVQNKIDVYTNQATSTSRQLGNYKNWYRFVYTHELTHMLQTTNYSQGAKLLVSIFGRQMSPNYIYVPRWLAEGVAIYSESQLDDYGGRLNDGYFKAIVKARAKAGHQPSLSQLSTSFIADYPASFRYVYGAEFYSYLVDTYGQDKTAQLFTELGSSFWTSLDDAAEQVFDKTMLELFRDWKEIQRKASKDWQLDGTKVIADKNVAITNLTAANEKLYYFKSQRSAPFPNGDSVSNYLVEYNPQTGEEKVIKQLVARPYSSIQVVDNRIYYGLKTTRQGFANIINNGRGKIGVLYSYNLETGTNQRIISGEIENFTVLNSGEIIYTQENKEQFGSEIWSYQRGTKKKLGVVEQLISELKGAEEQIIAVVKENSGSWGISQLDLDDLSLRTLVDTDYAERAVNSGADKLYYSSNYSGQQSIYEYNLATKNISQLTNRGYAFDGVVCSNKLYFTAPGAKGIGLYSKSQAGAKYNLPPTEESAEEAINLSELDSEVEESSAVGSNLSALVPPNMRFLPVLMRGQDALGMNSYLINYDGSITWQTKLLKPLEVAVSNSPVDGARKTNLDLSYPLYNSSLQGLTSLDLNYTTDFSQSISGLQVGFTYPNQDISFNLQQYLNQQGTNGRVSYKYNFDNSGVKINGSRYADFESEDKLRVSKTEFATGDDGYQVSEEYSHKLLELRKGWWKQQLFIGDIYGNQFIEYAYNLDSEVDKTAYGYQLLGEVYWWKWLPLTIKLSTAYSDGDFNSNWGVKVSF